jgi:hypothetical protein
MLGTVALIALLLVFFGILGRFGLFEMTDEEWEASQW